MKKLLLLIPFCFLFIPSLCNAQEWMESLPIAQRLAHTQDKLILMVWEEASYYPLPVYFKDKDGKQYFVRDIFSSPELDEVLWDYFVPVKVNELMHTDMFKKIDGKRRLSYMSMFNDDSMKVMDANGNILATSGAMTEILDLSKFISRYAINTSFLKQELKNYASKPNFYSAYFLGERYIDFSIYFPKKVRYQLLNLSDIYFNEAAAFLKTHNNQQDVPMLMQRLKLTKLKQELVNGKSRRVLKQLNKMDAKTINNGNTSLVTFLYYTAYRLRNDKENFASLESEISLVNLKLAQAIVNINK